MGKSHKILGTGLSGLVGSRVTQLLSSQFEFEDLSLSKGVDITNQDQIKEIISSSVSPVILHMAAKTDVDGCEDDKILGDEGTAWRVNVEATENIAQIARKTGKKVIYISTDFVFDGTKEEFSEEDEPNPVNWYGETKYQGERKILEAEIEYNIVRIASPYCSINNGKKDFVHRIISTLKKGEKISAVKDHFFTPTYIDDIAQALSLLLQKNISGTFHVAGKDFITPLDASIGIARLIGIDQNLIIPTTRALYFQDRAFRPRNLALKSDKIIKIGIKPRSFFEGLREFREYLSFNNG